MSDDPRAALRAPVRPNETSTVPKGGTNLTYMGHAAVTARLLDADPEWTWEPFATDEHGLPLPDLNDKGYPVGLWIRLTVCGVTRPGYGTVVAGKNESVKELIGDAIRNAAMRFGVGLELWHKGDLYDDTPTEPRQRPARSAPPASMSKAAAKKHVQAFVKQSGKPEADAASVWKVMALDNAQPWTPERLDQAVQDFYSGADPFDAPPPDVDPDTGEVAA